MKWFVIFMILLAIVVVCGVGCGLSLVAWKWLGWFGVVPIGLASTTVAGYAVWYGIGLLAIIGLEGNRCITPNQNTSESHSKKP